MNKKNTKILLIYILALLCILSAVIFTVILLKYTKTSDNLSQIKNSQSPANLSLDFNNEYQKHQKTEIKETNYLAGYFNEYIYEDIHFVTDCENWDDDKLHLVAEELFANTHGDEMKYVEAVVINKGYGSHVGSDYSFYNEYGGLPVSHYNFFHEESQYYIGHEKGTLYVLNVDEEAEVEDIAQGLSVAYGYHFTHYYFDLEGSSEDENTKYYAIRSRDCDRLVSEYSSNEQYKEDYNWYLTTIAANDYMYFLGSDNAHRIESFKELTSMGESLGNFDSEYELYKEVYRNCRNATPHVNVEITMPHRVDGLADYFYSFIDDLPPKYTNVDSVGDIITNIELSAHDTVYVIEWDVPYKDKDIVYTVVGYDSLGDIVKIIESQDSTSDGYTFYSSQFIVHLNHSRYYFRGGFRKDEDKIFRLLITFPDGTVEVSNPYILKATQPTTED